MEWSTDSAAVGEFSVSGDASALTDPDVTVDNVMTRDANCLGDFVTIPQGRDSNTETSLHVDRLVNTVSSLQKRRGRDHVQVLWSGFWRLC